MLHLTYHRFPHLVNLYLCTPVVQLRQVDNMSEVGVHFAEPDDCKGLHIVLEAISDPLDDVKLPFCNYKAKPGSIAEALGEIEV